MGEAKHDQSTEAESKRRILIIDDDEFTLALTESALEKTYDVRKVTQGAQALSVAQEFFPNLIILDLNMPNVDGFEILSQFKSHPFLSSIPILCLSADKSIESRKHTRELGAAGFLVKPVNKQQLSSDIDLLLKSSNIEVKSEDSRRKYFIAYNAHEKEKAMRKEIKHWLDEGQKVVVITLASGANFCDEQEHEAIEKEQLYFLQFKGNILTKLPFMEDLSPIIFDLEEFVGQDTQAMHLVLDDPDILLNSQESSSSMGHVFMFSELLDRNFSKISYFSKKPITSKLSEQVNVLANLLTGNI